MKLSKMQITGFGYLNNVATTGDKTTIIIHLDSRENGSEDVWLHCTACQEISSYIEKELLSDLEQGKAVLLEFCASYEGFSEAFTGLENSDERIVIFNAELEVIDAVYVSGSLRTAASRQAIAV